MEIRSGNNNSFLNIDSYLSNQQTVSLQDTGSSRSNSSYLSTLPTIQNKQVETRLLGVVERLFTGEASRTSSNQAVSDLDRLSTHQLLTQIIQTNVSDPIQSASLTSAVDKLFGFVTSSLEGTELLGAWRDLEDAVGEIGIGQEAVVRGFHLINNWDDLSGSSRMALGGALGAELLKNLGVLSDNQSELFGDVAQTLGVLSNKNASFEQKALTVGQTLSRYTGEENAALLVQAASVLAGNGDTSDKLLALGKLGIQGALANDIISAPQASQVGGLLSALQTVTNWGDMTDAQRISSVIQTSNSVISALSGQTVAAPASAATSTLANGGGLLSGIAGIAHGAYQAYDTLKNIGELPGSQAVKYGAIGVGSAGAAIGAGIATVSAVAGGMTVGATLGSTVPIVGTAIGALVGAGVGALIGAFGSGKSTGQKMRDGWRDVMEQGGFAQKIDGSHHVALSDGTLYNIGRDGRTKLENVDGSQRHTFDIDWSNPIANETIADAHIFAIATGIDPTSNQEHGLFDRAASQAWNAALSNASSEEEVRANFRSMLESGGANADQVVSRLELLRITNKITEQEYSVYLSHLNKIFNISLQPSSREFVHQTFVDQLSSKGSALSESETVLLDLLTNEDVYQSSLVELAERVQPNNNNI